MKKVVTGKTKGAGYIIGGLSMMTMGLAMYFLLGPPYGQSIGLLGGALVTGLLFVSAGLYSYVKEREKPVVDERSIRVQAQAGNISWFLSWLLLGALASLASLGVLHVSFELIVWVVWITMPWVFVILRFIIGRREEEV